MSANALTALEATSPHQRAEARRLAQQLDDGGDLAQALREVLDDVANGERILILRPAQEVTPSDAARILGVTRQFVDRLCADGVLSYRRLPGSSHRRIRVADLLEVASERERRRLGREAISAVLDTER